ncbi:DUF5131 family protein [Delftia acidovorans]|uniref:DUF5131 family protein n=1 Tax=Delftia acidovorans TaxID=80866 RepID=UPI002016239B|nr:DUF5131 family protein [Delftia acidovorans]
MSRRQIRRALDWVIVGSESGPSARPMHPDWAPRPARPAQRCRHALSVQTVT